MIRIIQSEGKLPVLNGDGFPLSALINYGWLQRFIERQNFVSSKKSGTLKIIPTKQLFIEKQVGYNMGCVKREFLSGLVDEDLEVNIYETHFNTSLDDGRTFGLCGVQEVMYADVASGGRALLC